MSEQRGFTLSETLVASAVFMVLMVGVFAVYAANGRVFNRSQTRVETHQNSRIAIERMAREVRMAGYDLSGTMATLANPTPIQVGEDDRMVFVADLDRDGVLDQVTYRLVGEELVREISSFGGGSFGAPTSSIVAEGLTRLRFSYYDDVDPVNNKYLSPVAASDLDKIRRITLGLTTVDTIVAETDSFTHTLDVRLRNP